jgi:hypothetical protein
MKTEYKDYLKGVAVGAGAALLLILLRKWLRGR